MTTTDEFKTKLNLKEISNIILACESLMEQLKDDATWEIDNKERYYDLWDIRNKLNDLR
tara:strand:- start:1622 stop:1798 length:177 start_codon:yes stop_codon:yes gene_type:complete